ncbi:hypothetical protein F4819DRAFT_492892 [Hypoxylon fuscum]|nr:hypothetical protein F4819DRAFT_492892 [Hypoxylon fuscum]
MDPYQSQISQLHGSLNYLSARIEHGFQAIEKGFAEIMSKTDSLYGQVRETNSQLKYTQSRVYSMQENSDRRASNAHMIKADPRAPLRPLLDIRTALEIEEFPTTLMAIMELDFASCTRILQSLGQTVSGTTTPTTLKALV